MSDVQNPQPDFSGSGAVEYNPAPDKPRSAVGSLLARRETRLLAIQGVTSVGIGLGIAGSEVLEVGVVDAGVAKRLPEEIEGVPLVIRVTGPVDALGRR